MLSSRAAQLAWMMTLSFCVLILVFDLHKIFHMPSRIILVGGDTAISVVPKIEKVATSAAPKKEKVANNSSSLPDSSSRLSDNPTQNQNRKFYSQNSGVVALSYLIHGPPMRLRIVVENALKFAEDSTLIIMHISTPPPMFDKADPDWTWICETNRTSPRLFVNPTNYPVRGFTGKVLHTHLLNFEYAKALRAFDYFVFLSDDCTFHRRGFEDWIRQHRLSFSLGFTAERDYDLDVWRAEIKKNVNNGNFSILTEERVLNEDRYYTEKIMGSGLYQKLGRKGLWHLQVDPKERFINHYQLEGSFYPREVIQRFSDLLDSTGLRKELPEVPYFSGEIWIPCYILKHEVNIILHSEFVPAVIGRYRDFKIENCCVVGPPTLYNLVHDPRNLHATAYRSVFGIKYQRPHLEAEYGILYQRLCLNRLDCAKALPYRDWLDVDKFHVFNCTRNASVNPESELEALTQQSWVEVNQIEGGSKHKLNKRCRICLFEIVTERRCRTRQIGIPNVEEPTLVEKVNAEVFAKCSPVCVR